MRCNDTILLKRAGAYLAKGDDGMWFFRAIRRFLSGCVLPVLCVEQPKRVRHVNMLGLRCGMLYFCDKEN